MSEPATGSQQRRTDAERPPPPPCTPPPHRPSSSADVQYNARGLRARQVTPGTLRIWSYDPETARLNTAQVKRTSDAAMLQDLRYTYDPIGNVMEVRDRAQQVLYFQNSVVVPSLRHSYDAAYRLIRSEGRELGALGASSMDWTGEAPLT